MFYFISSAVCRFADCEFTLRLIIGLSAADLLCNSFSSPEMIVLQATIDHIIFIHLIGF